MDSITPKERFSPCPYCNFSISSNIAKCEQCGLEVSVDGIDEIVRMEEEKSRAMEDSINLKSTSILFSIVLIPTYFLIAKNNGMGIFLIEISFFIFFAFIWKLIKWHQNHLANEFDSDILKDARSEKNKAIMILLFSLSIFLYFILRLWQS